MVRELAREREEGLDPDGLGCDDMGIWEAGGVAISRGRWGCGGSRYRVAAGVGCRADDPEPARCP